MAALMYILLCLIWGTTWLAIKIGLADAPPLITASVRFLVAVSILALIMRINKYSFPKTLKDALRLSYPGVYMYGLSYALIYLAEQYISSALTAVLFGSFPFFVAVLTAFRIRSERLHLAGWIGLITGFAGVVLISYDSKMVSNDLFLGTLLALAGAFAAAYGMIIHKKRFVHQNIVTSACIQMLAGGTLLIAATLSFEELSPLHFTPAVLASILYLAVFGTVISFLGYYWLMRRMTAVSVSSIAFVTPLVAIAVGYLFANEVLTPLTGVGTALILMGIVLIIRIEKPEKVLTAPEEP